MVPFSLFSLDFIVPYFWILVGGEEFESPTPWMSTKYSNQLN